MIPVDTLCFSVPCMPKKLTGANKSQILKQPPTAQCSLHQVVKFITTVWKSDNYITIFLFLRFCSYGKKELISNSVVEKNCLLVRSGHDSTFKSRRWQTVRKGRLMEKEE